MAKKENIEESDVVSLLKLLDDKKVDLLKHNITYQLLTINKKQMPINLKLFKRIVSCSPKFQDTKLNKTALFTHLFGRNAKYDDDLFQKRLADLKQAIIQFVAMHEMLHEDLEIDLLLQFLNVIKKEKQVNTLFKETKNKIQRRLEKKWRNKNIDIDTYNQAYRLYDELVGHQAYRDEQMLHFKDSLYYSELRFLAEQLNYYCHFVNLAINSGREATYYDKTYFQHLATVLPTLPQRKIYDEPIIKIFYAALQMLKSWKSDDEKPYKQYKNLLLEKYEKNDKLINLELFSVYARHNLITYAQNYLIWKSNIPKNENKQKYFALEQLDLYSIIFEYNDASAIQANFMRNILLRTIEHIGIDERLENFIKKYSDKVEAKHRKAVTKYSYAHLHFAKKEYKKAIEILLEDNDDKTARMPNYFFKLDSYRLLIKSIFEVADYEALEKYINRFRTYLTNHETKENKALFERHRRFLVYLKELLEATHQNDKMILQALKEKIERKKDTVNSEWLLGKIGN